jgi:hypothetical protein
VDDVLDVALVRPPERFPAVMPAPPSGDTGDEAKPS